MEIPLPASQAEIKPWEKLSEEITATGFATFVAAKRSEHPGCVPAYINGGTAPSADACIIFPELVILIQEKQGVIARGDDMMRAAVSGVSGTGTPTLHAAAAAGGAGDGGAAAAASAAALPLVPLARPHLYETGYKRVKPVLKAMAGHAIFILVTNEERRKTAVADHTRLEDLHGTFLTNWRRFAIFASHAAATSKHTTERTEHTAALRRSSRGGTDVGGRSSGADDAPS